MLVSQSQPSATKSNIEMLSRMVEFPKLFVTRFLPFTIHKSLSQTLLIVAEVTIGWRYVAADRK